MSNLLESKHTEHGVINRVAADEAVTVGKTAGGVIVLAVSKPSGGLSICLTPENARHLASVLTREAGEAA